MKKTTPILLLLFSIKIQAQIVQTKIELPKFIEKENITKINIKELIQKKAIKFKLGKVHTESDTIQLTPSKNGYYLRFENGWVYYHIQKKQTYAISPFIMNKWKEVNYEAGWLGFPISDYFLQNTRSAIMQDFENGIICYNDNTGAHFIAGAFKSYWFKNGKYNNEKLGFPKTDEIEIFENGYTRYQQFEKGTIFFSPEKEILYSSNPNETKPPAAKQLSFIPIDINSANDDIIGDAIMAKVDLYGWMDVQVFTDNDKEITDNSRKSKNIFKILEKNHIDNFTNGVTFSFNNSNLNLQRNYDISIEDINKNAFIRITYWLNDHDYTSSNDYLRLSQSNGSWKYNNGNHPYREIKIKDILNNKNEITTTDTFLDGSERVVLKYLFKLN